jgi:cell division septal protein FtsQ
MYLTCLCRQAGGASKKMSKQKNSSLIKKFFWLVLLVAFWSVTGWVLFFSNYTEIKNIQIKTDKIDQRSIKEIFNNLKEGKYLNFIPKNNFFLFPRKSFKEVVENEFELARQVNFANKFPGTFKIEVVEREAIVVWQSQEKYFLMDERGIIFREISENEKEERYVDYLIVKDDSLREVILGDKIEGNSLAVFVKNASENLEKELNLKIKREISVPSLMAEEIRFVVEDGWEIYFDLDRKLENQISLLKKVITEEIENRKGLEYVDLRIEGKVIYRKSDGD